ncbi:putative leader peptide [Cellulosimicrobium sp. CUA-896]
MPRATIVPAPPAIRSATSGEPVPVSVPTWYLTERRDVDLRRVASALCR